MNIPTKWLNRLFDAAVLFRIYTVISAGLYGFTSLLQPETLIYQVAHADAFTKFVLLGLCLLTIIGALDVTINDLLPERFELKSMLKDRHLISMAITLCFAVQMWSCVKYGVSSTFILLGIQTILIPVAAFYDIHRRFANR